jgi:putative ABC transport system substrate-binding protein
LALGGKTVRRRDILCAIAAIGVWPLGARAQQPMPVVGFLSNAFVAQWGDLVEAFRQGLREGGYEEGRNVAIDYRFAEGVDAKLPALAAELIQKKVSVIFTSGGLPPTQTAKAATSTIPIVFVSGNDPVEFGLVKSLSRPEANLTGISMVASSLGPKQLGLLRELVPKAATVGLIINPGNPNAKALTDTLQTAAQALGIGLEVLTASTARELDAAFDTLVARKAEGLVVANDTVLRSHTEQFVNLAARHAIPVIYPYTQFVAAGGLMSYGTSLTHSNREGAIYVSRILKGAKPNDLPVLQATKFELFINLKAAKALGITIPSGMMAIADQVID